MTLPLKHIIDKMNSICQMSPDLQLQLMNSIVRIEVPKDQILIEPGQICDHYYYIETGVLSCHQRVDDIDYCKWLMFPGDIATAVESFNLRVPAEETIRSVTSCILHLLSWKHAEDFRHTHRAFADIRDYLSNVYALQAWDLIAAGKRPPEKFYEYLKELYGEQLFRLPRKALAGLLGISEALLYTIIKNDRSKKDRGNN